MEREERIVGFFGRPVGWVVGWGTRNIGLGEHFVGFGGEVVGCGRTVVEMGFVLKKGT